MNRRKSIRNILIFGHSNIGDVVYDLAVVEPLRKAYPDSKISFLTSVRCKDIADGYKNLDRVILFDRHGKDKGFKRLRFMVDLRKERFDLALILSSSLDHLFLGIPNIWSLKKRARLKRKHPVDCYIDMLRLRGIVLENASFSFTTTDSDFDFCDNFLKQNSLSRKDVLVGILPLAAWSLKSWPISKWNELAEILSRRHRMKILNLGKIPDNDLGRRVAKEISDYIISADKTTLTQAKALLACCRIFIGPDSSLLHLASCMGIETIGLYGATASSRFYPYFHRHNIIQPRTKMSCMPCYPGREVVCSGNGVDRDFGLCMEDISVEDVLAVIEKRLKH